MKHKPCRGTLHHAMQMMDRFPHVIVLNNLDMSTKAVLQRGVKTQTWLLEYFKERYGTHYRRYYIPPRNGVNPWTVRFASLQDAMTFKLAHLDDLYK